MPLQRGNSAEREGYLLLLIVAAGRNEQGPASGYSREPRGASSQSKQTSRTRGRSPDARKRALLVKFLSRPLMVTAVSFCRTNRCWLARCQIQRSFHVLCSDNSRTGTDPTHMSAVRYLLGRHSRLAMTS